MLIADLCIRRPVLTAMGMAALVGVGWVGLGNVGVDLWPRIEIPFVAVTTLLPGATPDTIETEVTDVIEEYVNTISGLKSLRSISSEGVSQVFLEFQLSEDADVKAQDVRDKVSQALRDLPLDAEPPVIEKVNPDASPVLSVMVSGGLPIRELTRFAEDVVKERIERVPGVGSAKLVGGRDREVRIWADAARLRSYGVAVDELIGAIRSEHAEIPGGKLEAAGRTSEFSVKTKGEVESVAEFAEIAVGYRAGRATRVGDVARVEDGMEDERSYAELDGQQGVALEVRKQSGRNSVEIAQLVRKVVDELQAQAPAGARVVVARDVARFIEASARDVAVDIAIGAFLAVVVTLAFLRSLRSTLIVATAIPVSVISTFFLFDLMDFSLNMLTLMALSVAIGLLIDDAIVVLEAIHREIEAGHDSRSAASLGSERIGAAVIASTISVLAVFLPLAFMEGVFGRFMREYGLAISFSVAVSLLVAVTLTPMLCSRLLRREEQHGRVFTYLGGRLDALERAYASFLELSLRHRGAVLVATLVAVLLGGLLARGVPVEFDPKVDRSEFEGFVELPLGAGIAESKRVGRSVADALRAVPGIDLVFLTVGSGAAARVNEMIFYVETTPKQQRDVSQETLMESARDALRAAAPEAKQIGVNEISWAQGGGFTSYNVEYAVSGPKLSVLEDRTNAALAQMREDAILVDTKSSFERGRPELQVHVDRRRAADLGVPVRSLALTVRALVGGVEVASFEEDGERYDVRVRLAEQQRDEIAELAGLQVRAQSGQLVDLGNVARLQVATGPAQIERQNRARKVSLFANTREGVALGTASARVDEIIAGVKLPERYSGSHQGAVQRMQDASAGIQIAFALAVIALYMILASQFESLLQPAVIMISAPLSFAGGFAMLRLGGFAMSVFAQIALIALMGLVMKNGILLIDYANQLRREGKSAREAILAAGPVRMRPILMTQLATIAGMVPVALSQSDGAEFRNPMGAFIIGGLLSSTFLTLLVVPALYTLAEEGKERLGPLARGLARRVAGAAKRAYARPSVPAPANSERAAQDPAARSEAGGPI